MDIGLISSFLTAYSQHASGQSGGNDDAAADFAQMLENGALNPGPRWIPRATPLPQDVLPVNADAEPEYFLDHEVVGHKEGLPVIQETPAEEAQAVDGLLGWAASRGQNLEETTFIKGNVPVYDEKTGTKIGYRIVTAMSLPMPPLCEDFNIKVAMPDV